MGQVRITALPALTGGAETVSNKQNVCPALKEVHIAARACSKVIRGAPSTQHGQVAVSYRDGSEQPRHEPGALKSVLHVEQVDRRSGRARLEY